MVAGTKYVPAEAKALPYKGGIGSCVCKYVRGHQLRLIYLSMHLQDIPMHGRSEIVRR